MDAAPLRELQDYSHLADILGAQGIKCIVVAGEADLDAMTGETLPNLALIDVRGKPGQQLSECVRRCSQLRLAAIALVSEEQAAQIDPSLDLDDFVLLPPRVDELIARARWVLNRTAKLGGDTLVRVGDLVINPSRYEVSVKGRRVNLRFKEYELLLLMTKAPGRVYTRESLLNQIWGYDYLGGTRTVDVHIRRLRTKIEDADHHFIETIWNVGYRFRDMERN